MRFLRIFIGFVVLAMAAASAAEIKIKVVDPQSAAVAGAQVELFRGDNATPSAIQPRRRKGWLFFAESRLGPFAFAYWLRGLLYRRRILPRPMLNRPQ